MVVKLMIANKDDVQSMGNNLCNFRTAELWLQDGLIDKDNEQIIGVEVDPDERTHTSIKTKGNLVSSS